HPMSTGIYNLDGTVNYDRFEEMKPFTQKHNGKEIITESNFYLFLNDCRQKETREDKLGLALLASNGEWSAFWDDIGFFNGKTDNQEKYITVNRLRKFFEDSQQVGKKIENQVK